MSYLSNTDRCMDGFTRPKVVKAVNNTAIYIMATTYDFIIVGSR